MTSGLVSTIIPVYNRPNLLKEAVHSVLNQTYCPIEIIIVDDGSSDTTPEVADNLASTHPGSVQTLHVENRGAGPAREAGRQVAQGEFIQYLDSDDLLLPDKFSVQVDALRKNSDCGIAYGITRLIDEDGTVIQAPYKWTAKTFDTLFPTLLVDRWWNTHTPLYRRSVCDAVGPWADMRMSEDWEYEARLGALDVKLIHCPDYLSDTRRHSNERLTGNTTKLKIHKDIGRLLKVLYASAQQAGVLHESKEMRHFARWVFAYARQSGAMGDTVGANEFFDLAVQAAGNASPDMKAYRSLTRFFGWTITGRVAEMLEQFRGQRTGAFTLKQSWMQ